jgi:hypothetical protein
MTANQIKSKEVVELVFQLVHRDAGQQEKQ